MTAWFRSVCGSIVFLMVCGLVSASAAFGGATHEEFDFVQDPFYVPCLDEEVAGVLHISLVVNERASQNGGFHVTMNARQQGDLVGLTSGTVWHCHGVSNFKANAQGAQGTFSVLAPLNCVAPGDAPNTLYKFRIALTVNANGDVSTSTFLESLTCQG